MGAVVAILVLRATTAATAHDEPSATPASAYGVTSTTLLQLWGPKEQFGAWYLPPLPPVEDRMQAVHVTLLPSGKVLVVNGSSFRIKREKGQFQEGIDGTNYDVINNTALYDPKADRGKDGLPLGRDGFRRIASPRTPVGGEANDLFCAGHLQTPEGNVLFVGGNRRNYPGMIFTGSKFANLFDWKTETWRDAGTLKDGHWYPTLVELNDGRIAAFSGLSFEVNAGNNANSPWVEFYDSKQPPNTAWTSVNIRSLPNSPFNSPGTAGGTAVDRMDHYPRVFPLPDGRLFFTGDGSGGGNSGSRNTYFMTIRPPHQPGRPPDVVFERGPDRPSDRRVYGTALVDPNSPAGDILLIGGMLGSERTVVGPEFPPRRLDAVTANLERFRVPGPSNDLGSWDLVPQFLGDRPDDVRVMHVATILPNKQFLILGGGNFAFHRPVYSPQLFTATPGAPGGYTGTRLNPATQPRLYHSVALLLPDGRIFTAGGNAVRAAREVETGEVFLDTARDPKNDSFSFAEKGKYAIPAEIHQIEIFYPPYLFAPGKRPVIEDPKALKYGKAVRLRVENMTAKGTVVLIKLGSTTHACDYSQRLIDLAVIPDMASGTVTVEPPTNRNTSPPGYYMLFYVSETGLPSVAPIVHLGE